VFEARTKGALPRHDRTLALSWTSRLIFERLQVWDRIGADDPAERPAPIDEIEISQQGRFGLAQLSAADLGVPALGYGVSLRALQRALDEALDERGVRVRFESPLELRGSTSTYAYLADARGEPVLASLAILADGGGEIPGAGRIRVDYDEWAFTLRARGVAVRRGRAFERFCAAGPLALIPRPDGYAVVWTLRASEVTAWQALAPDALLERLNDAAGPRVGRFASVTMPFAFPLSLEVALPRARGRAISLGNAAQKLHPIAAQGYNLGLRDAWALAELLRGYRTGAGERGRPAASFGTARSRGHNTVPPLQSRALDAHAIVQEIVSARAADRWGGVAFTHGLHSLFALRFPFVGSVRGLALTLLDIVPPAKRAFTYAVLHGLA
jgi:2-octaprenyl-6-methoxyphenol hydroxylase